MRLIRPAFAACTIQVASRRSDAIFWTFFRAAQAIGYTQQVITTNGYRLHRIIEAAIAAG